MQAHKNVHPRSSRYADIDTGSYRMMTAEHLRVLDACEQRILLIDTPFDRHVHEARVPSDQIKDNQCYNKFYNEIKNINVNENIEYNNNLNLIWTKSMKFIRKYLYIFENNIY